MNPPIAEDRTRRRRRLLVAAFLAVCLLGGGMMWWWRRPEPLAEPPSLPLAGLDAPVARSLEQARTRVQQAPRSAFAWGKYGMVLGGYGLRPEAIRCFVVAEQLDPQEARWPYFRGVALQMDGADAEAVAALRRAVQLCPLQPDMPRLRLAEMLLRLNELEEAEEHFRRLLAQQSGHPPALLGLARLAMTRGELEVARRHLRDCLDSPIVRKAAHLLLAEVQRRLGDAEASRQTLEQASSLSADIPWPDLFQAEIEELKMDRPSRIRLILKLHHSGEVERAEAILAELENDYPGSGVFLEGLRLLDAGDTRAAVTTFREAVRLAPNFPQAHYWLGMALRKRKEDRAAAASFRTAAQLQPRHADAYEQLGMCLQDLGDAAGALDAFRTAAVYLPQKAELQRRLGALLAEAGNEDEALFHLRQARSLQPGDARTEELLQRLRRRAPLR